MDNVTDIESTVVLEDQKSPRVETIVNMNDKVLFRYMLLNSTYGIASKIMLTVSVICLILLPFSFFFSKETTRFALALIVFLNLVLQPLRLKASSKKQMLDNPVFKTPMHYVFDQSGIVLKQEDNDGFMSWEEIIGVKETKHMYLFYINPSQAFIIPKVSFKHEKDILTIRELVNMSTVRVKKLRK
ncbi:MAG: YcxB family protein [Vallitaleaceae bacterium]|jgi:hypothetical protein|nr:YcxB family protein [Vallitaleaceae bacterium]